VIDCLFCRIAAGELNTHLAHQDEQVVAFADINPQAPTHLLIVPRLHIESAAHLSAADDGLWAHMLHTAQSLAGAASLDTAGYRLVVNTGDHGGQTVPHLHLHLLGGRAMGWPPG
jgi:histidine triad (HIT) family protein